MNHKVIEYSLLETTHIYIKNIKIHDPFEEIEYFFNHPEKSDILKGKKQDDGNHFR